MRPLRRPPWRRPQGLPPAGAPPSVLATAVGAAAEASPPASPAAGATGVGFTLVELLVVITLLTIIAASFLSTFMAGVRLWARARQADYVVVETLMVLEGVARDVQQGIALSTMGFEGTAQRVMFPAVVGERVVRLEYAFEDARHTVWRRQVTLQELEEHPLQPQTLERPVLGADQVTMSFAAYVKGADHYEWKEAWDPEEGVPHAVRWEVRRQGETIIRTVLVPIAR